MNTAAGKSRIEEIEIRERALAVFVTLVPFVGTVYAVYLIPTRGFGWTELLFFLPMYILCEVGAEVGHHRLFSHAAFVPRNPLKIFLAILASMTGKGSVFEFAAVHRRHHQYSDRLGDPHSPYEYGESGLWNRIRGFWHSYYGWLIRYPMRPSEHARVIDLLQDPLLVKVANKRMYYFWLGFGFVLPAAVGFIVLRTLEGALTGLLWGGAVRMFFEQHSAYTINAACHSFGYRSFSTPDQSRNSFTLGYLTLGVGWHNNHHAFPYTAYNQFRWWEADPCGWLIKFWERLGWVSQVRIPSLEERNKKRVCT